MFFGYMVYTYEKNTQFIALVYQTLRYLSKQKTAYRGLYISIRDRTTVRQDGESKHGEAF